MVSAPPEHVSSPPPSRFHAARARTPCGSGRFRLNDSATRGFFPPSTGPRQGFGPRPSPRQGSTRREIVRPRHPNGSATFDFRLSASSRRFRGVRRVRGRVAGPILRRLDPASRTAMPASFSRPAASVHRASADLRSFSSSRIRFLPRTLISSTPPRLWRPAGTSSSASCRAPTPSSWTSSAR